MVEAIRVRGPGGPEVLKLEDVELPPPGPGEAQIAHRAIGVNYIDIYRRTGAYPVDYPFTPGHEGAGEVTALGEGVEGLEVGDRVAYVGSLGAYSQARNIEASSLVKLPPAFSFETGAVMMLKGLTAQYLLFRTHQVKKDCVVLVHAGAGGVGHILCQWANALGAHVIATVGSQEKAKIARAAGAHHAILYKTESFVEKVRELTSGRLCDVVYDGVGQATFPASLDCLRPFGLFASFGSASGPIKAFDINLLSQKGSLYATRPSLFTHIARRADLEEMTRAVVAAVEAGAIRFDISQRFGLAEAARAHEALEARKTHGALVLIP